MSKLRWLWRDNQAATGCIVPLPGRFDIGERYSFGIDPEFATRGQRPNLREGFEDGFGRNAAAATPVQLEARGA